MGKKNIVLKTYMNKPERIQSVLEYYTREKLPEDWASRCEEESGFYPVVNLMLYWGKQKWQKPLNVRDMVNFSEVPLKIKEMFKNYGVNIVDMRSIPEEALEEMKSDLKYVLGIMKCGNSSKKYIEYIQKNEDFFSRIPKSAADVINVCMNIKKINELLEYTQSEDGEECADMCKAVDDMIKHSEERGRKQGRKQGRESLLTLIKMMTEAGEANLVPRLSQEPDFLKSMYKKYRLEF